MNPFRNIMRLASGDLFAKTLSFITFVYLARILGVDSYGHLEFAIALLAYFILLADGGLELWATREAALGSNQTVLAGKIVALRLVLAIFVYGILIAAVLFIAALAEFQTLLLLFGLTLFTNALSLKWVYMGQQNMGRVVKGLVLSQVVFSALAFGIVRTPADLLWVPLARIAGEIIVVCYFSYKFHRDFGTLYLSAPWPLIGQILKSSLPLGVSSALAIMSFNFDMVLLGFISGTVTVGLYSAAYKPIAAILAGPVSYFLGLFPVLSKAYVDSLEDYQAIVARSLRLLAIFAIPVAVGGTFLAQAIIDFLFGSDYAGAVPALQLLSWAASFIILRGTFRQALNAAGKQRLDLRCALISVGVNVVANLLLIPRFGLIGAAVATVLSEFLWLILAAWHLGKYVVSIKFGAALLRPIGGAIVMALWFMQTDKLFWLSRGTIAVALYLGFLFVSREPELVSWMQKLKPRSGSSSK